MCHLCKRDPNPPRFGAWEIMLGILSGLALFAVLSGCHNSPEQVTVNRTSIVVIEGKRFVVLHKTFGEPIAICPFGD